MASTSKQLREERAAIWKQQTELNDAVLKRGEDSPYTAEENARWEALDKQHNELTAKIEAAAKEESTAKARAAALLEKEDAEREIVNKVGRANYDRRQERERGEGTPQVNENLRALAFQAYVLKQSGLELSDEHRRAAKACGVKLVNGGRLRIAMGAYDRKPLWQRAGAPTSDMRAALATTGIATGGALIPEGFINELERTMLAFNGPMQVARVLRTDSGNPLPWPTVDDTSNSGEDLAENDDAAEGDVSFGAKTLGAHKFSSKIIRVSEELMQDSAINLAAEIGSMLGERLGRRTAAKSTTGTGGGNQPQGIAVGAGSGVTAGSATVITPDEMIDLAHAVDPSYRTGPNVGYMFHDSTLLHLRKKKDGTGAYLYQPGAQEGAPDRIAGYPFTINQNMATIATGATSVLFGDFSKFIIRMVRDVRFYRMDERYREYDQIGFVAFVRMDSAVIQASAIKKLVQA